MLNDLYANMSSFVKVELDGAFEYQEEEFIIDHRAGLTPSEVVQSKLLTLLPNMPVPVSCMHTVRDTRRAFTSKG